MEGAVAINFQVFQFGTHVGVTLDFIFPTLEQAVAVREMLHVKAEAAKLLTTLGFDTSELGEDWEVFNAHPEKT